MEWLKKRVWQLGIAVVLAIIAMVLMYLAGTGEVSHVLTWIGLSLFLISMVVPLLTRLLEAVQENKGEEGES
ncbi:MAG: hypothetical protein PHU23_14780 [Dehalococcoidales bacterium]|nr:hypothetical protein [Dehalococcoidales bacterium]